MLVFENLFLMYKRALKRKIAIYKAQGNNCKAVEGANTC
jgi:hypothetical protein